MLLSISPAILETPARSQFSNLLDLCFPVDTGSHFLDDFPIWDPNYSPSKILRLGIWHQHELIACAGVRKTQLLLSKTETAPIAQIGAVATHPRWRGKGLASRLIPALLQWAENQGCWATFLWGSEHHLYERFGFELYGQQLRISLKKFIKSPLPKTSIHRGWTKGLFRALQNRSDGLLLTEEDLRWYPHHLGVQWLFTGSPEAPTAYAAIHRGIDLTGLVHEWGGTSMQDLFLLFHTLSEEEPQAALLCAPHHLDLLQIKSSAAPQSESLCLARVQDPRWKDIAEKHPIWIWGLDAV